MRHYKHAKKAPPGDWHPADIKAALEKAGWSLRRLSAAAGLHSDTLRKGLAKPYPKCERIIAEALGVSAETIWPSRYEARRHRKKDTTATSGRNVKPNTRNRHDRQAA